jgi:hypothetical protein
LRAGLALSEREENDRPPFEKVEFDQEKIQDAASDLCLEISRFTENPMFRPGAVFNVRNAKEAEHALDAVINLSINIKNSADKLRNQHHLRQRPAER